MHIGFLAPEFPPMLGGMAELARGLAAGLAAEDRVSLFCLPRHGIDGPWKRVGEVTGRRQRDLPPLLALEQSQAAPDVWLAMNAGLVPLAPHLRRPFFAYFHGNDFTNPWLACGPRVLEAVKRPYAAQIRHPLRRRAIARALPWVVHTLTNSEQTRSLIVERLPVAAETVSVVHPGVGDAFFQDGASGDGHARPDGGPLRILTVTRLSSHTRRKNVDGVLEALSRIGGDIDFRYRVVGDGDDRPRLEALSRKLGLGDRVHFTGKVDEDGLLAAYRGADLFILASKATEQDVEGFGIVYIEAAASGVPSICSRAGGATDAVDEAHNGLLIDDSSPASIADGIRRFVAERGRFSPRAIKAYAEGFRWPRIAGQLRAALVKHLPAGAG
ncbi:MAG: glycosyltransferase family 4 protein [Acidobacteriota bacterium]